MGVGERHLQRLLEKRKEALEMEELVGEFMRSQSECNVEVVAKLNEMVAIIENLSRRVRSLEEARELTQPFASENLE